MAIQIQGNSGTVVEVEAGSRAMRITSRPTDYGTLGHYRLSQVIQLVSAQVANGTLMSTRWGDSTRLMVLMKLRMGILQTGAHTTAQNDQRIQAFIARSFSTSDSVGTAVTLTGNNQKKRTNMGTSLVTDMRVSAVAAGLTVGTRTLDAQPFFELQFAILTAVPTTGQWLYTKDFESEMGDGNHPFVFATNEGMILRGPTSLLAGAAGTLTLVVDKAWQELASF